MQLTKALMEYMTLKLVEPTHSVDACLIDLGMWWQGVLVNSLALQTTTNGTTWVASSWTISPTYSYTNTTAGITYTFTGALVRGVRVVGLVNTSASSSKRARVREVFAYPGQNVASLSAPTMMLAEDRTDTTSGASTSGASKVLARPEQQSSGSVCATFGIAVTGCEARSYYSFGAQRVAMRVQKDEQPSGAVIWLHSDHLGSASMATDGNGTVVAQSRYKPFGEERPVFGTLPTDRKFTGQLTLSSIGLYDFNARMMSPVIGRFLSADTVVPGAGNPQALNRYSYGFNRPLM